MGIYLGAEDHLLELFWGKAGGKLVVGFGYRCLLGV
jgi:hypothetical protein